MKPPCRCDTREAFPVDWAMTQNNLGAAYSDLPAGDRAANLKQAIACYEAALQVRHPRGLSRRLGHDAEQPGRCLQELTSRRPSSEPEASHRLLSSRLAGLHPRGLSRRLGHDAVQPGRCLQRLTSRRPGSEPEASHRLLSKPRLQVSTREAFPVDWAMTQNNLGNAYSDLPAGDRAANLKQAIACYQAALQVFHLAGMDYYLPYSKREP